MTINFHFSIHLGQAGLEAIRADWTQLYQKACNPCFCNDLRWHLALERNLLDSPSIYVVAKRDDQLQAIIPLQRSVRKHMGISVQYLHMPEHKVADLRDILLAQDADCAELLPQLMHYLRHSLPFTWQVLEWRDFSQRSGLFALLQGKKSQLNVCGHSNYATRTAQKSLLQSVSHKQLRNAERLTRKIAAEGGFSCREYNQTAHMEEAYTSFLTVEQAGWKGEQGSAVTLNPRRSAFYRELMHSFAATNQASIRVLEINGKAAACHLGLRCNQGLRLLKIGYDEAVASLGPGSVVMAQCLSQEDAMATPEVNLLTSPSWSERWHFSSEPKYRKLSFNESLFGRLLELGRNIRARRRATGLNQHNRDEAPNA